MNRPMRQLCHVMALGAALALGSLCVGASARAEPAAPNDESHDPLEGMNRGIFWFNDQIDLYILEPAGKGWNFIAPDRVKKSVANFFMNLRFPIVMVNDLLQGKIVHSASDIGRFGVNTTVGVLGFFDPASDWGLEAHNEDFGQTLGWWGVPPGPYLVLPFFGPSSPRDTVGLAVDSVSTIYPFYVAIPYTAGARAVDVVNLRAMVLDEVRHAKEASVDYYTAVRNAYRQRRAALVRDGELNAQEQEDLYNVEPNGE